MAHRRPLFTRRQLLRGAATLAGAAAAGDALAIATRSGPVDAASTFRFRPFTQDLPIPRDVGPGARFEPRCFRRDAWLASDRARFLTLTMEEGTAEILPGVPTPIWGYDGEYPGPTIRARAGDYVFVRFENRLEAETLVHLHGGHMPADSDGYPTDYVHPGESRDYAYPMLPAGDDPSDMQSFLWYHDHTMDETGPNVYRGLAGLFLVVDDDEQRLLDDRRIPGPAHDVPLVLQDRSFNADGTLHYDFFDHDGFLGDVMVVNGKAQPRLRVERRKYRLRILNGANARMFELALSAGSFVQIGADSWLLPTAVGRRTVFVGMAERADVVVDFRDAPDQVFLYDLLAQEDGRGPGGERGDLQRRGRVPLLRFDVVGGAVANDVTVAPGHPVKPHVPIDPREVEATREFTFSRRNGVWVVNRRIFDPDRPFASPRLGATERWLLRVEGGGWWHPIHVHDEAMHVVRVNGRAPPAWELGNKDTVNLAGNEWAEVLIHFRDWPGRWVMHCHNIEHEDMRMMARFDVLGPPPAP